MIQTFIKTLITSAKEYIPTIKDNKLAMLSILVTPLLGLVIINTILVDISSQLPVVAISNTSTSDEAVRVQEVIAAYQDIGSEEDGAFLYELEVVNVSKSELTQSVKNGTYAAAIYLPNDFGSDNQNKRIQGNYQIIGDPDRQPILRTLDSIITEALAEYNSYAIEQATGVKINNTYTAETVGTIKPEPVLQHALSGYALLLAIPGLSFIFLQVFRRAYATWAKQSLRVLIKNSYFDLLIGLVGLILVHALTMLAAAQLLELEITRDILRCTLVIVTTLLASWLLAINALRGGHTEA